MAAPIVTVVFNWILSFTTLASMGPIIAVSVVVTVSAIYWGKNGNWRKCFHRLDDLHAVENMRVNARTADSGAIFVSLKCMVINCSVTNYTTWI